MRALVVGWLCVSAGCWTSPAVSPPSEPVTAPARRAGIAKPLAGPFADLAAYCATRAGGCWIAPDDMVERDLLLPGTRALAVVVMNADGPTEVCAIAMQTRRGWFVSAPSKDACYQQGLIQFLAVRTEIIGKVFGVHVDAVWWAADRTAAYTLTTFCGMAAGAPACLPWFVSECEERAPASDCIERGGYHATWRFDGESLTVESRPRSASLLVPHGTHRLF